MLVLLETLGGKNCDVQFVFCSKYAESALLMDVLDNLTLRFRQFLFTTLKIGINSQVKSLKRASIAWARSVCSMKSNTNCKAESKQHWLDSTLPEIEFRLRL